jgi:hypothetical protein
MLLLSVVGHLIIKRCGFLISVAGGVIIHWTDLLKRYCTAMGTPLDSRDTLEPQKF